MKKPNTSKNSKPIENMNKNLSVSNDIVSLHEKIVRWKNDADHMKSIFLQNIKNDTKS